MTGILSSVQLEAISQGDTLPKLFLQRVHQHPDRVAMRRRAGGAWHDYSWADCFEHVLAAAHGLLSLGVKRGDAICILAENRTEWVWADLAAEGIGAVVAGIYTTAVAAQAAYIMGHCEARILVAQDEKQVSKLMTVRESLPQLQKIIILDEPSPRLRMELGDLLLTWAELEALGRQGAAAGSGGSAGSEAGAGPGTDAGAKRFVEESLKALPDETSVLVYTSGTTGSPKGAMLSHRNQISAAKRAMSNTIFTPDDVTISFLPICHIVERMMSIFAWLYAGYTVHYAGGAQTILPDMVEISPTILFAVPRIWEKIYASYQQWIRQSPARVRRLHQWAMEVGERRLDLAIRRQRVPSSLRWRVREAEKLVFSQIRAQFGLARMRVPFSGGAPIEPKILRFFAVIGVPVTEGYGMTETTGSISRALGHEYRFGTVGPVQPGLECRLAEDGEILVRGQTVFKGYLKDPDATAAALQDGWLKTGDVGQFTADGSLRVVDRKKDIIITAGGKNVAPQEIENRMRLSPFVRQVVVVGDRRKFVGALIQIDSETVGQWAEANGVPYTDFASLAGHPAVVALIQAEVDRTNATLGRVEQIRRFALLDRELDQESGELTATQKIRRKVVETRSARLIAQIYAAE